MDVVEQGKAGQAVVGKRRNQLPCQPEFEVAHIYPLCDVTDETAGTRGTRVQGLEEGFVSFETPNPLLDASMRKVVPKLNQQTFRDRGVRQDDKYLRD